MSAEVSNVVEYVGAMAGLGLIEGDILLLITLGAGLFAGASARRLHALAWGTVVALTVLGVFIRIFVAIPMEAFTNRTQTAPLWLLIIEWICVVGLLGWAIYLWLNPDEIARQARGIRLPGEAVLGDQSSSTQLTVKGVLASGTRGLGRIIAFKTWGAAAASIAVVAMMIPDPPFLMAVAITSTRSIGASIVGYAVFALTALIAALIASLVGLKWGFVEAVRWVRHQLIRFSAWLGRISAVMGVAIAVAIAFHAVRNWPA
ncbi:MAG: hypothetical protein Q4P05_04680 [Actinomycetaceae bacterium]|nr:hypothetical protein [Actinomycetaceae bacterium]